MNLSMFCSNENLRNVWIKERSIEIYIRRSNRCIGDSPMIPFIDLASVTVDENYRGCRIFTSFLERLEQEAFNLNRGVYVESILEKRLLPFLTSKGYQTVPNSYPISPSMFKLCAA